MVFKTIVVPKRSLVQRFYKTFNTSLYETGREILQLLVVIVLRGWLFMLVPVDGSVSDLELRT